MLRSRQKPRRSPQRFSLLVAILPALGAALASAKARAQTEVPPTPLQTPMTFELVDTAGLCDDCSVVQVSGRFALDTGSEFWGFVARSKLRNTVIFVLDAAGGSLDNAVTVSLGIRHLKASTVVGRAIRKGGVVEIAPGSCIAACPMALAGGMRRSVPDASIVGVRSWLPMNLIDPPADSARAPRSVDRRAFENFNASTARYMTHLDRMGVDLRMLIRTFQTPNERLAQLHPQELKEYRIVTEESAIRVVPGRTRPVLVLPQPARAPPGQAARG